jgi:hypothetical protein
MARKTGRNIIVFATATTAAAGLWAGVLGPEAKERITTLRDQCGELHPFYQPDDASVDSCSPLIDQTTQQTIRGAFRYTPAPGSTVELKNGNYAVGVHLSYEETVPSRLFGQAAISLMELDDQLRTTEETRAFCVGDMARVVDLIKQNTASYETPRNSAYELGIADNAYEVWPAGRGENAPAVPDLFIYDADSNLPPEKSIITCWEP